MQGRWFFRFSGAGLLWAAALLGCDDNDTIQRRTTQSLSSDGGSPLPELLDPGLADAGHPGESTEAYCGDLDVALAAGEECEPPETQTCDEYCRTVMTACGNSLLESGEECDDGNASAGDGCTHRCLIEACGNGRLDIAETCEPPGTPRCSASCQAVPPAPACGNARLDPGEECEVSLAVAGDGCNASCQKEICGNGRVDPMETCEPPGTATCDAICKLREEAQPAAVVCGDGMRAAPEECDDGDVSSGDGCGATCLLEVCGNGRLDFDETCEPPSSQGCSASCRRLFCGDGVVTPALGEECDDVSLDASGRPVSGDGCSAACLEEECGNLRVDVGEGCEPPSTATCSAQCEVLEPPVCGDSFVQAPEECDDGDVTNGDGCDSSCQREFCGNGRVEPPEQCELPGTATCNASCRRIVPECGNRFVDVGEECDDGDREASDGCNGVCQVEACANGRLDFAGECEPPNTVTCDERCRPIIPVCGDGKVEGREECEDGGNPPVGGDGCSAFCLHEACGNGTLDVGEGCEPPGVNRCGPSCQLLP